jgi:hypothetical protein
MKASDSHVQTSFEHAHTCQKIRVTNQLFTVIAIANTIQVLVASPEISCGEHIHTPLPGTLFSSAWRSSHGEIRQS